MIIEKMVPQSDRKRLRGRLSLHEKAEPTPEIALLPSNEHPDNNDELNVVQLFEHWLWNERNDFCIRQAREGLGRADVRISKTGAARRLKLALAALEVEGGE